jgi:hypothetical protein
MIRPGRKKPPEKGVRLKEHIVVAVLCQPDIFFRASEEAAC